MPPPMSAGSKPESRPLIDPLAVTLEASNAALVVPCDWSLCAQSAATPAT